MSGWWIADYADQFGTAFVVSWLFWVIFSIVLHELSHGWVALALGDDTPRVTGHMTWNPLVHMGGFSLILLALIGIAWGAMPVNPSRFRGRFGDAKVSAAGPAMNLLLAMLSAVSCVVWVIVADRMNVQEPLWGNLARFFWIGAFLNVVLAMFNLIPAPPLDGCRILASFVPAYGRIFESPNGQWFGLGIFLLVFWLAADLLFAVGMIASLTAINLALAAAGHQTFDPLA
ncbi:MAG: site-2 protease family protein [Leptolyngbya sp. PLA3]|nr:MAG: site-2 protease family protein [Cyanobacteria bacterium CYA]MCE7967611.1 site-2 protease family protein [Leptolyngbya sp. PL-A3]